MMESGDKKVSKALLLRKVIEANDYAEREGE